jgi:hypothetical protein
MEINFEYSVNQEKITKAFTKVIPDDLNTWIW